MMTVVSVKSGGIMSSKLRLMFLPLVVILMMCQAVYADEVTVYADEAAVTQKDIDEGINFCRDYPVLLNVDGYSVESEVPPVIIKEKTMIPLRAVFERMGAEVSWNGDDRLVEISMGDSEVQLTIDSSVALVNGEQKMMEVPALIINDTTMIPLRFVGESLNCKVGWEDLSRTVLISSPEIKKTTLIESIKIREKDDYYRVTIKGEDKIEGYSSFAYDDPQRFGVDISSSTLEMEDEELDGEGDLIEKIRFAQFTPDSVRVVVDLAHKVIGKVSFSSDGDSMYIDFDKDWEKDYEDLGDVTGDGLDVVDWRATGKLVVIDPGHGGADTGSQAISNGVTILNEKAVNLDIALRLNRMLKAAGANTYILREDDTTITLYDRPAKANELNADLFVSVHNNSTDKNPNASGTEVYYYSKPNECDYHIYSKELAELAQKELTAALGTVSRGAKSEPAYAVLNKTQMPAIIIEGAFLSNAQDLELMMTDEFRENYAKAAAKAIIAILNKSVE